MHAAEVTWLAFALFRGLRIFSYFPQIVRCGQEPPVGRRRYSDGAFRRTRPTPELADERIAVQYSCVALPDVCGPLGRWKKGGSKSLHVDGTRNCEASYLNSGSLAVSG